MKRAKTARLALICCCLAWSWAVIGSEISPLNVTNIPLTNGLSGVVVSGKYLYAVGSGLQIFDISNPANPSNAGSAFIPGGGGRLAVSGNYSYVTEGSAGSGGRLDIFDVSNPANPVQIGQIAGNWGGPAGVAIAGARIYIGGFDGSSWGVFIYDISTPASPTELGHLETYGSFAVSGDRAYVSATGIHIWDVSDPVSPRELGHAPDATDYYLAVAVEGDYVYAVSGTNGFPVFDVSNPSNPVLVADPSCGTGAGIALSGNYGYAAWGSVFTVFNISNPTNTSQIFWGYAPYGGDYYSHQIAVSHNYAYFPTLAGLSVWSLGIPAPALTIGTTLTNTLVFSWPVPAGAFSIQETPRLNPTNWLTLTNESVVVGSQNQMTILVPNGNMFYRLVSQ